MSKDLQPGQRAVVEPMADSDLASMDALFDGVMAAVKDYDSNLVLSVLCQILYQSIPGEELTNEQAVERMNAMLGLLNLMRDGYANRVRDPGSLSSCVADLTAVVRVGSRPIVAPALVYTLVGVICNGKRNQAAENAAVASIAGALDELEMGVQ